MRKSNLERLRAQQNKDVQKKMHVNGIDGFMQLLLTKEPNPTQRAFILDDSRFRAFMGPVGSAKTSALCAVAWLRLMFCPGYKGFVSRYDYNDLVDTTGLRLQEMLSRMPEGTLLDRDKSPPMKWWIKPIPQPIFDPVTGEYGGMDERPTQLTFMGLKDDLGSYEGNFWIVDEGNEVEEKRFHEIDSRLRYPGFDDYVIATAFNPPDKHHWMYTACTGYDYQDKFIKAPWMKLFRPQKNENAANLPPGYYDRLAATMPDDMKQRLIDGDWGSTFEGQPVYREFKPAIHVFPQEKFRWSGEAVLRFWDFGYHRPCCIWAFVDYEGRLKVVRELLGHNKEVHEFVQLVKARTAEYFPNARRIVDYGDPAVKQQKDTGSTLAVLMSAGVQIRYRPTKINEGVQIIRRRLNLLIDGEPAMQFSREGCPILISALRGGYHLDEEGKEPVKDGYYDHEADAFRYGCVNIFNASGEPINGYYTDEAGWSGGGSNLPDNISYNPDLDPQR